MRHHECVVGDFLARELDDIEIQSARAPALLTNATGSPFDLLKRIQQRVRCQLGVDRDHLIEVRSLAWRPEWSRLLQRGHGNHFRCRKTRERIARDREIALAISEIGAQRDVGDVTHPARARPRLRHT